MGQCIITRRGGGADGLERLAAIRNWTTFNGRNPSTGETIKNWYDGSTATIPADKFCAVIFGQVGTNYGSTGILILVIDNRQVLASIGVQTSYSASITPGGKITLTSGAGSAACATIGTI